MSMTGRIILTVAGLMVAGVLSGSARASTVTLKNNRTLKGLVEWREATQEYVVTTADGQLPVALAQVALLDIDKPAEFDAAASMVKSRLFGQAIPRLEAIMKKYHRLNWDAEAGKLLAQSYLETNDAKKGIIAMDVVFASGSRDKVPAPLLVMYWKALLASGSKNKLQSELTKAVGSGSLEAACTAYLMRGNLFLKNGDEEEALSDFLKVTILGSDFKALQPEALFKAADLMDKARDPRGMDFRKKLVKDYPGNEFSAKASAAIMSKSVAAPVVPAAPATPPTKTP
ncbi:MAG: hypothetical protein WCO77_02660 [bacterium]